MVEEHFNIIITLDELRMTYDEKAFEDGTTLNDLVAETYRLYRIAYQTAPNNNDIKVEYKDKHKHYIITDYTNFKC